MDDVTRLLSRIRGGDDPALGRVVSLLYDELKALAHAQLRGAPQAPLRTTALVHEAWLKLVEQRDGFANRAHFFSVSATLMRRIVVDQVRAERAQKRGGDAAVVELEDVRAPAPLQCDVLALDAALERLRVLDALQADLVELRAFAGLTIDEAAAALDRSPATIKREWAMARAFLLRELA